MSKYFENDSISYSLLRNLSIGPAYAKKVQEEEQGDKEHFIIGSCVDILLTEPDKFWEMFYLEYQEKCEKVPTGQMKDFIDKNFEYSKIMDDIEAEKKAYEDAGFKRKTFDSVIEEFVNEWLKYDNWLHEKEEYTRNNSKKQLISNSQYQTALSIVESLKTNKFTRKYFTPDFNKNIELKFQLEIYWEFKGQKCKSKLDLVLIDHDSKEIHPIDIKTSGKSTFSFNLSSLQWRYDLQASFYSTALYWLINHSNDEYWSKFKDYSIKPFKFIVESSNYQGFPLIWECSDSFLLKGADGFYKDGRYYKGFVQLIEEYVWHKTNNSWDYPKDVIENDGILVLNYE